MNEQETLDAFIERRVVECKALERGITSVHALNRWLCRYKHHHQRRSVHPHQLNRNYNSNKQHSSKYLD